jgi:uncharacterized membrane protein YgcG
MNLKRLLRHALQPPWSVRRAFTPALMQRVEAAVRDSERSHRAELRVAVEAGLELESLWRGQTPRERAEELFAQLRVWDTAENSGVLLYINWADRDIEIVADRGISSRVAPAQWEAVCQAIEASFRDGRFEDGLLEGIRDITRLLSLHFPAISDNVDELGNRPVIL